MKGLGEASYFQAFKPKPPFTLSREAERGCLWIFNIHVTLYQPGTHF